MMHTNFHTLSKQTTMLAQKAACPREKLLFDRKLDSLDIQHFKWILRIETEIYILVYSIYLHTNLFFIHKKSDYNTL
jgi:hypothetical protein